MLIVLKFKWRPNAKLFLSSYNSCRIRNKITRNLKEKYKPSNREAGVGNSNPGKHGNDFAAYERYTRGCKIAPGCKNTPGAKNRTRVQKYRCKSNVLTNGIAAF